ncbi:aprataxin isoform X2 [Arctopsyche grandis]
MNDPDLVVDQDSVTITIKDKYPKAKHHFLIMSKENIPGIMSLNKENLKLLHHMKSVADKLCSKFDDKFKIGYHSVPSMQRLHLHVISDDFVSPCLKTKVHWNSFTTTFFMTSDDLIRAIDDTGSISKMSKQVHKELINTPLKCHKCNFVPKTMPNLKEHLLSHIK